MFNRNNSDNVFGVTDTDIIETLAKMGYAASCYNPAKLTITAGSTIITGTNKYNLWMKAMNNLTEK